MEERLCKKCLKRFPFTTEYFYPKRDKNRPNTKMSTTCITCSKIDALVRAHKPGAKERRAETSRIRNKLPHAIIMKKKTADRYERRHRIPIHKNIAQKIINSIAPNRNRLATFPSDMVGCTREFFKQRFESMFVDGMTWENYGTYNINIVDRWSIDHIRPKASWGFGELHGEELQVAIKECWHYTNLQPLWGPLQNLKGSKYDTGITATQMGYAPTQQGEGSRVLV